MFREAAFWAVLGAGWGVPAGPAARRSERRGLLLGLVHPQFRAASWGQVGQPAIPLRVIRDGATAHGKRGLSSEAWLAPENLVENWGADLI
jgi:hypothetical protein